MQVFEILAAALAAWVGLGSAGLPFLATWWWNGLDSYEDWPWPVTLVAGPIGLFLSLVLWGLEGFPRLRFDWLFNRKGVTMSMSYGPNGLPYPVVLNGAGGGGGSAGGNAMSSQQVRDQLRQKMAAAVQVQQSMMLNPGSFAIMNAGFGYTSAPARLMPSAQFGGQVDVRVNQAAGWLEASLNHGSFVPLDSGLIQTWLSAGAIGYSEAQTLHQIMSNQFPGGHFTYAAPQLALDPAYADTMGWRYWHWDPMLKRLRSPVQHTVWEEAELHAHSFRQGEAVRGVAGIHAAMVPVDWRKQGSEEVRPASGWGHYGGGKAIAVPIVTGIVERFGKFVKGTVGWRCEHAVIRQLLAPDTDIGLALEKAYPEATVHYMEKDQ